MSETPPRLQEFLDKATAVLDETEVNLAVLARAALLDSLIEMDGTGSAALEAQLKQVSQHLRQLSERSKALQTCLQNGLVTPPPDDEHWSRIRILQSHEEERAQLARELEEAVGQLLANAVFELASSRQLLSGEKTAVAEGLDALQTELEEGLAHIRYFITNLEPATILGQFGLSSGLRRYLEQYGARTGLEIQLLINTTIDRLPSIIETAIFRIVQEALHNVDRHARASRVDVVIEEVAGMLQFSIIDNGEGLLWEKVNASKKKLGLARMVDYAELLGGKLRIFSEPGHGTRVVLSIPYPAS